jgi:hypothetical protein
MLIKKKDPVSKTFKGTNLEPRLSNVDGTSSLWFYIKVELPLDGLHKVIEIAVNCN